MDPTGRTPGRGAYVCRDAECIDLAIKKGALNRTLRTPLPTELHMALLSEIAVPLNMTIEGGAIGQE